ncbi:MAG: DNA-processing protein DprA [Pseudomonadota bacterium]
MPKPDPGDAGTADRNPADDLTTDQAPDLFASPPLPVAELDDTQRIACLRLIRSDNVGPVTFRQLINHYGGAAEALEALPEIASRSGRKRALRICSREAAIAELEAASRCGATPIFTIEPGYPRRIALTDVPPPMLYAKGRLDLLNQPSVAIVGARQCSAAGQKLSRTFALELGKAGLIVVSGLARGIDGAAHIASVETGTIAVVAGGVDVIYPPEHDKLHAQIAEQGCIISEMPCGFRPRGKDFPRRNRLISAASLGVLVIEAARRSGTLSTARMAGEQGRSVFAIPGNPLDPRAEGTNLLIKNGATLVTEASDIIDALAPMTDHAHGSFNEPPAMMAYPQTTPSPSTTSGGSTDEPSPTDPEMDAPSVATTRSGQASASPVVSVASVGMSEEAAIAAVEQAIGPAPVEIDDIIRSTGLPARQVRTIILELDLAGAIEHHGSNLVSTRV